MAKFSLLLLASLLILASCTRSISGLQSARFKPAESLNSGTIHMEQLSLSGSECISSDFCNIQAHHIITPKSHPLQFHGSKPPVFKSAAPGIIIHNDKPVSRTTIGESRPKGLPGGIEFLFVFLFSFLIFPVLIGIIAGLILVQPILACIVLALASNLGITFITFGIVLPKLLHWKRSFILTGVFVLAGLILLGVTLLLSVSMLGVLLPGIIISAFYLLVPLAILFLKLLIRMLKKLAIKNQRG
jgi:hypothetical protein